MSLHYLVKLEISSSRCFWIKW